MFKNLPRNIQAHVIAYLNEDNFPAAKALHDSWNDVKSIERSLMVDPPLVMIQRMNKLYKDYLILRESDLDEAA